MTPKVALAQLIFQFTQLPEERIAEIVEPFTESQIPKNTMILKEGQVSDRYFFLSKGCIRAFTIDLEGNEITTNLYVPGEMVFEVNSFFQRIPTTEYFIAESDVEVCWISFEKLNEIFHALPHFREFGRAMLVRGFVQLKQRTLGLINEDAEKRYLRLMNQKPDIFRDAQLKHIASYLGITDSSLSRIRKNISLHAPN